MAVRGAFTIPSMSTNNPCFSFVRLNAPPVFVRLNATPPILTVAFTFTIDSDGGRGPFFKQGVEKYAGTGYIDRITFFRPTNNH